MTHLPGLPPLPGGGPHSLGGALTRLLGLSVNNGAHGDADLQNDSDMSFRSDGFRAEERAHAGASQPDVRSGQTGQPHGLNDGNHPAALGRDHAGDGRGQDGASGRVDHGAQANAPTPGASLNFGPITSLLSAGALIPYNIVMTFLGQNTAPLPTAAGSQGPAYGPPTTERTSGLNQLGQNLANAAGQLVTQAAATLGAATTNPALPLPAGVNPIAQSAPGATNALVNVGSALATATSPSALPSPIPSGVPAAALAGGPPTAGNAALAPPAPAVVPFTGQNSSLASGMPVTPASSFAQAAVPATSTLAPQAALAQTAAPSTMAQTSATQALSGQIIADRPSLQVSMPQSAPLSTTNTIVGSAAVPGQTLATVVAGPLGQTPLTADPRAALPLAGGDRAQTARGDLVMAPAGHTGEAVQRRTTRGGSAGQDESPSPTAMAMGAAGNTAASKREDARRQAERELERAMQWVFWVLAIVAYGSLAFTLVALLPAAGNREDIVLQLQRGGHSWLALVGLVAGGAAWLIARRLARGG